MPECFPISETEGKGMTHMPAARAHRLVEKLPTGFRIYPEKSSEYFWVWVYPTQAQMIRFSAHLRRTAADLVPDALAYVHPVTTKGMIGYVLIWEKHLNHATVSHEIFHAVAWWAHRKRLDPVKCLSWKGWKTQRGIATHERMAEAMGKMAAQFWRHIHDAR
jgi:hypothetical protein